MSFMLSDVRKFALAGAVAAVALTASTSGAEAATKTLNYSCNLPFVGATPVSTTTNAALPSVIKAGKPAGPFAASTVAKLGGNSAVFFDLIGASSVEGSATPTYTLNGGGLTLPIDLALAIPATTPPLAPKPVVLKGAGVTPILTLPTRGSYTLDQTGFALNLTARDADGVAMFVPSAEGAIETDDNPETFDVNCTLSPATQNTRVASFKVIR